MDTRFGKNCACLPPVGLQMVTGPADFIRHFPPMSAAGTRSRGRCSAVPGVVAVGVETQT
jgi:hypothetical protein